MSRANKEQQTGRKGAAETFAKSSLRLRSAVVIIYTFKIKKQTYLPGFERAASAVGANSDRVRIVEPVWLNSGFTGLQINPGLE